MDKKYIITVKTDGSEVTRGFTKDFPELSEETIGAFIKDMIDTLEKPL